MFSIEFETVYRKIHARFPLLSLKPAPPIYPMTIREWYGIGLMLLLTVLLLSSGPILLARRQMWMEIDLKALSHPLNNLLLTLTPIPPIKSRRLGVGHGARS